MNAERIDDPAGQPGADGSLAPGQRGRRATSRRGAGMVPSSADLPSTPAGELPAVPLAAPTTALPMTPPLSPAMSVGDLGHAVESPTTELRGALSRPEPRNGTAPEGRHAAADARVVPGPMPTNIYRSRRPGVAILLVIPTLGIGLLLVRALAIAAFGDTFDIAGIVASISGLASLPFLVAGIYGLVTGAAHGAEHYGFRVWARPPLAYLIVGLSFVIVAGLAVR